MTFCTDPITSIGEILGRDLMAGMKRRDDYRTCPFRLIVIYVRSTCVIDVWLKHDVKCVGFPETPQAV